MAGHLLVDFECGTCSKCGCRREDMQVSTSHSPSIGYQELAYSANLVIQDWIADLNRHERRAPLSAPEPPWQDWCATILGTACTGCIPVIRADWFLEHPQIRACQQLPREAFVAHTNCALILFVSHRWESAGHPDVSGRQALYLGLFLASRFDPEQLRRIGIWYDFAVLPQEPRSVAEQAALDALLPRVPEIQRLSRTLICSDFIGTATYAQRAWCFLEFFGSIPREAGFVSGISYRHASGHAVAEHEAAALTHSLAYLLLSKLAIGEEHWRCERCGFVELKNPELNAAHQCGDELGSIPAVWERLAQVEKLTRATGVGPRLPEHLRVLLRQRPKSRLDMIVAFNWACHLGACWHGAAEHEGRRAGFEQVEAIKRQLGLCHQKCQRLLLAASEDAARSPRELGQTAHELDVDCTRATDLDVVMRLCVQECRRLLDELSDPRLVDANGCTAAHLAAEWQALPMLKALTAHNPALLDSRDHRGRTLLHSAVFGVLADYPGLEAVFWLLDQRPDLLRTTNDAGEPPFAEALGSATLACIQLLVSRAPDLVSLDFRGGPALHLTAHNPDGEPISRYLLGLAPDLLERKNASGQSVLHAAAQAGNAALVALILEQRPDMAAMQDDFGDTPLHVAVNPQGTAQRTEAETPTIIRLLAASAPETARKRNVLDQTPLDSVDEGDALPQAVMQALREVSAG